MYNVLIVDEEEHLLWALEQNLFPDRTDIQIDTATTGEDGLERLKSNTVDLLISDIKMPGRIDGFQLILRAKEVAPEAKVIIMTAFGTNRIQNFADRIGVTHYVEKPFNTSDLRDAILEILDEKEGFQGVLSDLELTDIIQMLCLAKRTALLHLKHKDHRGKIVFDNGEVVHSEFDDLEGDDAVYHMLSLRQGDIFMQSDFVNDRRSVTQSWQDLLFEGVKRADEKRAAGEFDQVSEPEEDYPIDAGIDLDDETMGEPSLGEDDTQFGMGVSASFFSESELREIERAGEEFELEEDSASEFAPQISQAYDDSGFGESPDSDHAETVHQSSGIEPIPELPEEFKDPITSPFNETPSAEHDPTMFEGVEEEEEFQSPFRPPDTGVHRTLISLYDLISPSEIQYQLNAFASECPGLKLTAVVSPSDGLVMNSVQNGGMDAEALAPFFGRIVQCAQSAIDAFSLERGGEVGNPFEELQLQLGQHYVIVRLLQPTVQLQVAVVDRSTSLGVALVLMRRFHKSVQLAAEV